MAVDTATTPKDLDTLLPEDSGADGKRYEGAENMRQIKTCLACFTEVDGDVTATHTELNILDGVTSTTAELNILDGVTSTTAELNILDGVTSTAAELNILDGVTSTAAELNILDGVTSTTAELNILDGVTSTATELNLLDGVTAFLDEDDLASDSATAFASQQSIKAYVDNNIAGQIELLETWTPTAVNEKDFTFDDTAYCKIIVVGKGLVPATDNRILSMRLGYSNGSTFWTGAGEYEHVYFPRSSGGTNGGVGTYSHLTANTGGGAEGVGNDTNEGVSFTIEIDNLSATGCPSWSGHSAHLTSSGAYRATFMHGLVTSTGDACDAVKLYWSSSANFNTVGKIYVYGVKQT